MVIILHYKGAILECVSLVRNVLLRQPGCPVTAWLSSVIRRVQSVSFFISTCQPSRFKRLTITASLFVVT